MSRREPTELEIREIAVTAQADPRTVKRVLAGEDVRGIVKDRIKRAIDASRGRVFPADRITTPAIRRGDSAGGTKREA